MIGVETLAIPARTHGRVLVRRAAEDGRVLVGFHGYAEQAAVQLERLIGIPGSEHWTLVSVQGLNRFYRGRNRETIAGWMTREDRLNAIADNIAYVDAVLDAVLSRTPSTLVCAGFSQGVAMAFRAALRGKRPAQGVIAVAADVPPELLEDPAAPFPRVLLLRGRHDDWYTQQKMTADVDALRARDVVIRAEVFEGGHGWPTDMGSMMGEFLGEIRS